MTGKDLLWIPEGLDLDIEDDLLIFLKNTPNVKKLVLLELEEHNNLKGGLNNITGNNQYKKIGQSDNITLTKANNDDIIKPKKKTSASRGTSKTYILKRLKRDNPINYKVTSQRSSLFYYKILSVCSLFEIYQK